MGARARESEPFLAPDGERHLFAVENGVPRRRLTGCLVEMAFCASKFSRPLLHKLGDTQT